MRGMRLLIDCLGGGLLKFFDEAKEGPLDTPSTLFKLESRDRSPTVTVSSRLRLVQT